MNPIDIVMRVLGGQKAATEVVQVAEGIEAIKTEAQGATQALATVNTEAQKLGATAAAGTPLRRMGTDAKEAKTQVGLARGEMVNLGYQIQDIGVMLAMGANPFTILVTQGTQVAGILSASKGGVAGALADIRTRINTLPIPPFALWMAGATAAATAVAALIIKLGELRAEMVEQDAVEAIQKQNRGRFNGISNAIQELAADRKNPISTEMKEDMQRELSRIMDIDVGTKEGIFKQQTELQELYRRIQQIREAAAGNDRAIELAKSKAQAEIFRLRAEGELAQAKEAYENGTLELEKYLEKRRELVERGAEIELSLVAEQLRNNEEQMRGAAAKDLSALQMAQETLKLERIAIEQRTQNELATITREGVAARIKNEKERTEELNEFHKRLIKAQEEALERFAQKQAAVMRAALNQFQDRTNLIGSDFTMTEPQRYEALRRAAEAAAAAGTITREELVQFKAQLGPDPSSWVDQWSSGITRLADSWGTLQQTVVGSTLGLINSGVDALAGGIARAVVVTGDLKQAWADVKIMVLQALAQEVIGYGIRKGLALGWKALTSSLRAADTAETVTAESTKAAAAAPAATMMSISSWGLAAIIGGAAILGALASVAFREQGGPVEAGKPYIVGEKRPELFIPRTSGVILPSVPAPSLPNLSAGGGSAMGGGGAASAAGGNMQVAFYGSAREAMEGVILSGAADAYLANIIDGRVRRVVPGT